MPSVRADPSMHHLRSACREFPQLPIRCSVFRRLILCALRALQHFHHLAALRPSSYSLARSGSGTFPGSHPKLPETTTPDSNEGREECSCFLVSFAKLPKGGGYTCNSRMGKIATYRLEDAQVHEMRTKNRFVYNITRVLLYLVRGCKTLGLRGFYLHAFTTFCRVLSVSL